MKSVFKRIISIVVVLLIATVGYVSYEYWIKKEPLPTGLILADGRIEGDHVAIAGKFQGRIKKLLVREGDTVKKGPIVAVLDDSQVQARVKQADKAMAAVAARVVSTSMER